MKLKILNSGSVGNCYILETETTALIIECGVKFKDIMQALDFNLGKVAGVLISHEHGDHCKSVKDVMAAGLNVYASDGTIAAMKVANHHRAFRLFKQTPKQIGEFKILPFDVKHDAAEPFGFLIHHKECGNLLFVTDTYYVGHTFKGLNNILVEANYDQKIVDARLKDGNIHGKVRDRVLESHMSIETCKGLLEANDLTAVNNIVLIHLSDGNSNAADFKKQVQDLTGKTVHIAGKDMVIDLNKTPF
jgi:phosphoribosyl 1,2-cyclic phosphodiesterase